MTNEQICEHVKNYVKRDKTQSAIMLTAPWGKGKSYFVKNELIPYIEKDIGYQCITVSLYGTNSLTEISKSIYFESKLFDIKKKLEQLSPKNGKEKRFFKKKKVPGEFIPATKIVGSTVIKGLTSFVGIDLSMGDLSELYSSVDLSRKILIFEDVERTRINIAEFLGYVNNLVEQDGVKAVLICNEEELLHHTFKKEEDSENIIKQFDQESLQYLKIKEKTVSDTIQFKGNAKNAIGQIINNYDNTCLIRFKQPEKLCELEHLLTIAGIDNLRTFMFACQKTYEIFEKIEELNLNDKYLENIFYGIVLFSKSIKEGKFPSWEGTAYLSTQLTQNRIPLFRFCYNYIRWHEFDHSTVLPTLEAYDEYKMTINPHDSDLEIVFNYCCTTEKSVLGALKRIEKRLNDWTEIPICTYGKLAYHLVRLHFVLDYDFSSIEEKMLQNLKVHGQNTSTIELMLPFFEFETDEEKLLFEQFKENILDSIKKSQGNMFDFSYDPSELIEIVKKADESQNHSHRFVSLYEPRKLADMLFRCTAQQIDDFRGAMFSVYRHAVSRDFEESDRKVMQELLDIINIKKKSPPREFDKIQLLQINYLCDNLNTFLSQLS